MGEGTNEMNDDPFDTRDLDKRSLIDEESRTIASENLEEPAEIRAGIEQTRADMSETIDAIQDRLNPQHLKEQVKEQMREQFEEAKATVREATIGKAEEMVQNVGDTISDARYTLMDTIKQNPIPAALVGIGLSWLFMNRRSAPRGYARYADQNRYYRQTSYPTYRENAIGSSGYTSSMGQRNYGGTMDQGQRNYGGTMNQGQRYYGDAMDQGQRNYGGAIEQGQRVVGDTLHRVQETAGNVVNQAQEKVGNIADQAQETAGNVVNQAQETAGYLADQAQYQAQRFEDRFQQALYENPLAVGAVAVALGTAVGFVLPQTQRENELLGETRDQLIDRAQTVAHDTLEKVQQVAGEVMDQAQTTVQEHAKEHGATTM